MDGLGSGKPAAELELTPGIGAEMNPPPAPDAGAVLLRAPPGMTARRAGRMAQASAFSAERPA